jgi:hypothetical protein
MGQSHEERADVTPPRVVASDGELDALDEVVDRLVKHGEARRQEADASAATLMTTAVALGAASIAAANAFDDVQRVPELFVWVVLTGLTGALLLGGASRLGILQRLAKDTGPLWAEEHRLSDDLRRLAVKSADGAAVDPASSAIAVRLVKELALTLSCTTSEIHERTVNFKNRLLIAAGISLLVALLAVIAAAGWVLATA